jgi:hypothetical protein
MTDQPCLYRRHRFPGEIISHAVWLYHLFRLSLRDIELILAERGILVTSGYNLTFASDWGFSWIVARASLADAQT